MHPLGHVLYVFMSAHQTKLWESRRLTRRFTCQVHVSRALVGTVWALTKSISRVQAVDRHTKPLYPSSGQ